MTLPVVLPVTLTEVLPVTLPVVLPMTLPVVLPVTLPVTLPEMLPVTLLTPHWAGVVGGAAQLGWPLRDRGFILSNRDHRPDGTV